MTLRYILFCLVSTVSLCSAQTAIPTARVLGISLGTELSVVAQKDIGTWDGIIGSPSNRQQGTLRTIGPVTSGPYDAVLTPPEGFKYLGADLKSLGIYFFPDDAGVLKVFCVTFELDLPSDSHQDLIALLEKQFGPMTFANGWGDSGRAILLLPPEVALVDIVEQRKAEFWMKRYSALHP